MIKINNTPIKSPQALSVSIRDKQTVEVNAAGNTVIDRVSTKRVLELGWGALTNAEMTAILSAMSGVFFDVEYPDPETGAAKTITCYAEGKSAPMARNTGGTIIWEGLSMELIER